MEDIFRTRVPMLKSCPHFLRGRLRESFQVALRERHRAKMVQDEQAEIRAWKLFGLVPLMLIHRPSGTGAVGRSELCHRADEFARGHWSKLVTDALQICPHHARPRAERSESEEQVRRGKAAQARVHCGQVSRAQELTGATLAPKNAATLQELRARRPQEQLREISQEVMDFVPEEGVKLDAKLFATCRRSAPSGSSPGPGGCTNEMSRVCLDDHEALLLLTSAAEDFARASVPGHLHLFHHGHNDGIAQAGGRHPWHCNQHVIPQIGRKDDGQTWNKLARHSSSRCPHGRGPTVWGMRSGWSLITILR